MKQKTTFLKFAVICLLTTAGYSTQAQSISATDLSALSVTGSNNTDKLNAVLCKDKSFTLTASTTDENNLTYSTYKWTEINDVGGGTPVGTTGSTLTITNASPGYHTYRVVGLVNNSGGVTCEGDPELFTIFVLPNLLPNAVVSSGTQFNYCTDVTLTDAVVLKATPTFEAISLPSQGNQNPTANDFKLDYKWFKVKTTDATSRSEISGAITDSYTVNGTDVGSFTYEVEVTYDIKNCGIFKATAKVTAGGNDAIIVVSPKPGKPTITITSN